ncbi:unnamed protein product [Lactuca saligna]|uniref:poly(A)-specific ribonuclease n=1 Tax=Lactuca saligna TaxID=75948 RepID=A0AA35VG40_LACSI|nr:unnamed protein product [Lactuca saligna]
MQTARIQIRIAPFRNPYTEIIQTSIPMSIHDFSSSTPVVVTRIVNADNLEHEFGIISSIVDDYLFVSWETAFSGVILRSEGDNDGSFRHENSSQLYDQLKRTVEAYKPIQLGLTLADADGNLPHLDSGNLYVWEFNLKDFDPARDLHTAECIESLKGKGVDFEKNRDYGIDSVKFAELLMSSGLVCNPEVVTSVAFHSAYDFGYLLKMLTGKALPDDLPQFLLLLETFFGPNVYDVKHLMKHCEGLHGGLEQVAKTLKVEPAAGKFHLAGENSLLTWNIFQKIKDLCGGEVEKYSGVIYGLEPF